MKVGPDVERNVTVVRLSREECTCALCGAEMKVFDHVDPERYLVDVIDKLERGWPLRRLSELIPANWAAEKAAQNRAE